MGKFSTLIYLYNNFDEFDTVVEEINSLNVNEFEDIFEFIERNTKKVPDSVVQNVIDFAKNYS